MHSCVAVQRISCDPDRGANIPVDQVQQGRLRSGVGWTRQASRHLARWLLSTPPMDGRWPLFQSHHQRRKRIGVAPSIRLAPGSHESTEPASPASCRPPLVATRLHGLVHSLGVAWACGCGAKLAARDAARRARHRPERRRGAIRADPLLLSYPLALARHVEDALPAAVAAADADPHLPQMSARRTATRRGGEEIALERNPTSPSGGRTGGVRASQARA